MLSGKYRYDVALPSAPPEKRMSSRIKNRNHDVNLVAIVHVRVGHKVVVAVRVDVVAIVVIVVVIYVVGDVDNEGRDAEDGSKHEELTDGDSRTVVLRRALDGRSSVLVLDGDVEQRVAAASTLSTSSSSSFVKKPDRANQIQP